MGAITFSFFVHLSFAFCRHSWRLALRIYDSERLSQSGLCGRVRLLTARGLGQRFDCGVCPVPRCFEIAAIERDQRACDFEDRVRLIRQRLTAGFRKPRCQSADRVELADQHSGRRCGGLTNLIERELDKALDAHRPHPYPELATGVVPVSLKRGRSASVSSASASQSTQATPVNVS